VAADVPMFTEQAEGEAKEEKETFAFCQPADAAAANALTEDPEVRGETFQRGADGAVKVSSSVTGSTPDKAEAALDELGAPEVSTCFEAQVRADVEKDVPTATDIKVKVTPVKSEVSGADQAVLLGATITYKEGDTVTIRSLRRDTVLLRRQGTVIAIFYSGPAGLTTVEERQRIVAAVSKKLGGGSTGPSTTSRSSGSSTSVRGGGTSTSRSSSSTTTKATSSTSTTKP